MTLTWAILLIVVLVGAIIVFKLVHAIANRKLRDVESPNRYHKRRSHQEPKLGKNPLASVPEPTVKAPVIKDTLLEMPMDSDTTLGLTEAAKPVQKPESSHVESTQAQTSKLHHSQVEPPVKLAIVYLKAENGRPYAGYELLQAILSSGLRYGKHQVFHRHEQKTGQGDIIFSLASAADPGTFDLTKMGSFSTIGLSLFFKVAEVADPLESYNMLLQTAGELVEGLGGEVLDSSRQKLTRETALELREALKIYMEGQATADMFAGHE